MKLLVCGNRDWTCAVTIRAWLMPFHVRWQKLGGETPLLIHGACGKRDEHGRAFEGADELAHDIAFELGWRIEAHPADWDRYGNAAGPIRNSEMAERDVTRGLGFGQLFKPGGRPTGTGDMVVKLNRRGVLVTVVPRPGVLP